MKCLSRHRQHERECQVGRGIRQYARSIANRDLQARCLADVDVVVPHSELGDHSQVRTLLQKFPVDLLGKGAKNCLMILRGRDQFCLGHEPFFTPFRYVKARLF